MEKKKKIVLGMAVSGIAIFGSSLAFFTSTETITNDFTAGSINTVLHEEKWEALADTDHNDIPDMAEMITPLKVIPKDPKVENIGLNPAWIYLETRVPVKDIITADDDGNRNPMSETELFIFNADLENWTLLSKAIDDESKEAVYVYGYNKILDPGQTTSPLFEEVKFCNVIEAQGLEQTEQVITVKQMAIQSEQTGTMEEAYSKYINQQHYSETENKDSEKQEIADDINSEIPVFKE